MLATMFAKPHIDLPWPHPTSAKHPASVPDVGSGSSADIAAAVALTYRATIDVPARFRKSRAVGAVFGLTCSKYQSGEINRTGAISRCGDDMMRVMLNEAAQSMLFHSAKWSWLKAWAMKIARHRGMKKAIVALARRLAVIMHRIWVDGTEFRWTKEVVTA
jgi:transposase